MSGLSGVTTYYVKAYAKNRVGVAYGNEVSFVSLATIPTVSTSQVTNITRTTAKGGGNVTDNGGSSVTERGVCWSLGVTPSINDNHVSCGSGMGSFTGDITGLTSHTTYHVRAYAKNDKGIGYGEVLTFNTLNDPPTLTTIQVTNITQTTATCGGNVTNDGGETVTERGICWSTEHNPTSSGNHISCGSGSGSFTATITGLVANTLYYVRAYAKNANGMAYGGELCFRTLPNYSTPTVTTLSVSNITRTTAVGHGNVTSNGGLTVTEHGVCWSTNHNPTINNSHASNGAGVGAYTTNMNGLNPNTTYYVRAFAKNNQGISYGNEVSFRTLQ